MALAPLTLGNRYTDGFMSKCRVVSLRKINCDSSMDRAGSLRSSASYGGIRIEALKEAGSRPNFSHQGRTQLSCPWTNDTSGIKVKVGKVLGKAATQSTLLDDWSNRREFRVGAQNLVRAAEILLGNHGPLTHRNNTPGGFDVMRGRSDHPFAPEPIR